MEDDKKLKLKSAMDQHGEYLIRFIYLYVRDWSIAEDLVQETFYNYYNKMDQFEHKASIKTYLTRIAVNKCHDYLRSWKNRRSFLTELFNHLPHNGRTPEEHLILMEQQSDLIKEIYNLSVKKREVLLLYYYQEMTISEIASVLSCSESVVKTRLSRARNDLKENINFEELEVNRPL